jgi:hypothetical protein
MARGEARTWEFAASLDAIRGTRVDMIRHNISEPLT